MRIVFSVLLFAFACIAAPAFAQGTVYRCEVDGVMTYSDRPCGADPRAVVVSSERVSTYSAPQAKSSSAASPVRRPRRTSDSNRSDQRKAETCAQLTRRLAEVEASQRAGYRGKEGVKLDTRKRELKARLRETKC